MSDSKRRTKAKKATTTKKSDANRKAPPTEVTVASPVVEASSAKSSRFPAKSVAKAKAAFANFSLSKFAPGAKPAHYVDANQSTAAVQAQRMAEQLPNLTSVNPLNLAIPPAMLKKLLPSYNAKTGAVAVDDVINVLEQNRRGNEFFANGDPTLRRIAIQSQVQNIIAGVIKGAKS